MNQLNIVVSAAFILLIYTTGCGSQKGNKQPDLNNPPTTLNNNQDPNMSNLNDENHLADWRTIDSLENEGLPKSALEKVNVLYEDVKKENNPAQTIKCLIYKGKYESQLEEDGLVNAIMKMQNEMDTAKFPVKPVLQSVLAELYSNYLANNYYVFSERSKTGDFDNGDIQTWTV